MSPNPDPKENKSLFSRLKDRTPHFARWVYTQIYLKYLLSDKYLIQRKFKKRLGRDLLKYGDTIPIYPISLSTMNPTAVFFERTVVFL
ncbi:MAG: hypothetical protein GF421_08140 [Candidatus Aminicenantes bacterium]|nr:hypothetical protein [Candidatus Aminicenantes bacterium]